MIVVEGPDGSGKSSLVQALQNMTGFPVVPKAVSSDMEGLVDLSMYIESQLALGFGKRIYDRFALISGPIYGPVCGMRPPNHIFTDEIQTWAWMSRFHRVNPLVIYCLPPLDEVTKNLLETQQMDRFAPEVWDAVYWTYRMRLDQDTINRPDHVYRYDYLTDTPHGPYNWLIQRVGSSH